MVVGLTGARGVLGRRLVEALTLRGASVAAFDGDVRDLDALNSWTAGCTHIVHAAAVVPTVQVRDQPGTAIAVNVAGTANVAAAAALTGARLIYVSTSHVYESSNTPLTETDALNPVSLYGLTKLQGEQWVQRILPDALILRLFSYFDSRQASTYLVPGLINRIKEAPLNSELPLLGYRSQRDIADARWLATRLADLVLTDTKGTMNLGTGKSTSIITVASRLSAAAGRDDITWVPADDHPGDTLVADVAALHRSGFVNTFDLDAALREFVAESKI